MAGKSALPLLFAAAIASAALMADAGAKPNNGNSGQGNNGQGNNGNTPPTLSPSPSSPSPAPPPPCSVSDVTFRLTNADACYGPSSGNPNSLSDFNLALAGGAGIGNGWQQFLATSTTSASIDWNGFRFTFSSPVPFNSGTSGNWYLTITDLFPASDPTYPISVDLLVAPKAGGNWAAYVFDDEAFNLDGQDSGTWAISFNNNNSPGDSPAGLSHMNFLLRDFRGSECERNCAPPPPPCVGSCLPTGGSVPEPASLVLVGLGALGVGAFRRRRRLFGPSSGQM